MQRQEEDKTLKRASITTCPKCGSSATDVVLFYTGKVIALTGARQPRKNPKIVDVVCNRSSCSWRASETKAPKGRLVERVK